MSIREKELNLNPSQSEIREMDIPDQENITAQEDKPESFMQSYLKSYGRIKEDVVGGAQKGIESIPDYIEKAYTEIPGLYNLLQNDPKAALKQGVAGISEHGRNVFNLPHDLVNYYSNRLHLIPKNINDTVQMGRMPEDTQEMIDQTFGKPTQEGEALARGIGRNVTAIPVARNVLQSLPHLTRYGASRTLNRASQLARGRNIGSLNIDPALIEDTRQFLPNTIPYRNALAAAHQGHFNDLFRLQSDLGRHASDYSRSLFSAAERAHGRAGIATRNMLLDDIHQELQSRGHHDISHLMRQGQNEYRRYMQFKPYRNALALGLLSLAFPQNPLFKIGRKVLFHNSQ